VVLRDVLCRRLRIRCDVADIVLYGRVLSDVLCRDSGSDVADIVLYGRVLRDVLCRDSGSDVMLLT
jgi:hypothetical protein